MIDRKEFVECDESGKVIIYGKDDKAKMPQLVNRPEHEIVAPEVRPESGPSILMHRFVDGKPVPPDPREIVMRFATNEQLFDLAKVIMAERAARPAHTYWICKSCGFRMMAGPDKVESPTDSCIRCNFHSPAYKDKGFMRAMTKKEVEKFLADEKARFDRQVEVMKENEKIGKENFIRQHGVGAAWNPPLDQDPTIRRGKG